MPKLSATERAKLPDRAFAYIASDGKRSLPINDEAHVRNALARFDQVEGVSDHERDEAWRRIKAAARRFDVEVEADHWRELFEGGKERKH